MRSTNLPGDAPVESHSERTSAFFSAACDIGTTTLACYLVDASGKILAAASARNPQAMWGADVISRIAYSMEGAEAVLMLSKTVVGAIDRLLANLAKGLGPDIRDCREFVAAGNSAMELLFYGISPSSLGKAPFELPQRRFDVRTAGEIGLHSLRSDVPVRLFPLIDAFVGGDTTAAIYEITGAERDGLPRVSQEDSSRGDCSAGEKTRLLIDFGTNGEIALLRGGKISVCSTAAGPAFEGASIRQGMPALPGAVYAVAQNAGSLLCRTVHNAPARGLCGTGVVDAVALLLDEGILTPEGEMTRNSTSPLATKIRGEGKELRCVLCETCEAGEVALYQCDIREFQLAKGAVQAGIELLLEKEGAERAKIDECVLAGAFGSALNPESLMRTGVLRGCLRGRVRAAGNAAGLGAVRALREGAEGWKRIERIAREAGHLRLESVPGFQPRFLEAMSLTPR